MADASPTRRRRQRRQRRRRRAVAGFAGGALLIAGAGTARAMSGDDAPVYRFASVTRASVTQTVDADGSLSADDTDAVAFAVGGTVDRVDVAVGDTVTAGQTLATLDTDDLDTAVTAARTALAQAEEQLASDRTAQADGTTVSNNSTGGDGMSGSSSRSSSGSSSASSDTAGTASLTALITPTATRGSTASAPSATTTSGAVRAGVTAAQNQVIAAQRAFDGALRAQDSAVAGLTTSCATADEAAPTTATVTADGNGTAAVDSDACLSAVTTVTSGEKTLDASANTLSAAIAALTRAVAGLPSSTTSSAGTSGATGTSGAKGRSAGSTNGATGKTSGTSGTSGKASGSSGKTSGSTGSTSSGSSSSGGVLVTAERIAADARAVDAKTAAVAVARQSVRYATLTSTLSGTVAAVGVAKGDVVSAGSTSDTITVVGDGTLSVTVDIPLTSIDLVKVGQQADVTVDGRTDPVPATVGFVGPEDSSRGSSASYPVTVTLGKRYASLYDGMGAGVSIDVGRASDALTVPISALSTTARGSTVRVRNGSSIETVEVTVGRSGGDRAQITSGLKAGQQVVLAEVSAAVPSGNSTSYNRRGVGFSGLGGSSGGGPGGAPPGR